MERTWIRFVESDEMYWFLAKNREPRIVETLLCGLASLREIRHVAAQRDSHRAHCIGARGPEPRNISRKVAKIAKKNHRTPILL